MEKLLQKIARQLDALDEASLMTLWSKYATLTSRFEPTKRWEEACLIFSLIQAKRWKNQLFNYSWSRQRTASQSEQERNEAPLQPEFSLERSKEAGAASKDHTPCVIMTFPPRSE